MKNYQCTINTETLLSHRICNTNLPKKNEWKNKHNLYKYKKHTYSVTYHSEHLDIFDFKKLYNPYIFFSFLSIKS